MTNREKINQMNNDEFAQFMLKNAFLCKTCIFYGDDCTNGGCLERIKDRLESEVEEWWMP